MMIRILMRGGGALMTLALIAEGYTRKGVWAALFALGLCAVVWGLSFVAVDLFSSTKEGE